ncbi:metallophosphoesterase [Mariniradius saccharolyticus]|nr:metallophosphoesterase [Mariniradius saccharolyticus]
MKFFPVPSIVFAFMLAAQSLLAQQADQRFSEGPYLYYKNNKLHAKWIEDGQLKTAENLSSDKLKTSLGWDFGIEIIKKKMKEKPEPLQHFANVQKVAVISDVHGQFGLMVKLLRQHGVIDANNRWAFGTGHLVVNGDIAGRGNQVTEALWLVYHLEIQAAAAGGKVHYLAGNHEQMLLSGDNRFLNEKYTQSARLMGITIQEMYGKNSVLGDWLRNRPALVKIDDYLFVHAGISPEYLGRELTDEKTNKLFYNYILGSKRPARQLSNTISFLNGENGPIWYRGYFVEGQVDGSTIDSMLKYFDVQRIIVGHTSLRRVTAMHRARIIAVDSNIKEGIDGEILLIEGDKYFRGTQSGEKIPL